MPGITIERPKMTRVMYQSLKKHIMREREKKKQEQEHDKAMEQRRKEQELRKKKEQEDSLTLGQTKEQITSLETRLEALKVEKHELFSQLKKVLHQEDENRKRAQLKEHNEMINLQQQYNAAVSAHPIFMQAHIQQRGGKYMNMPIHQPIVTGVKRARSPSPPPPSGIFQHYPGGKYPVTTTYAAQLKREESYSTVSKAANYPSTHVTYASQAGHPYAQQHIQPPSQHAAAPTQHPTPPTQHQAPPTQHQAPPSQHQAPPAQHPTPAHPVPTQPHQAPPTQHQAQPAQHQAPPTQHQAPPHHAQGPPSQHQASQQHQNAPPTQHQGNQPQTGKYPTGQSAFQSYSTHYAHQQKQIPERLSQNYPRVQQPGFISAQHTGPGLSLQQQLEHANQKSGFSEEKFKMQQSIRGVTPLSNQQQAQLLATAQLPTSQPSGQPQPKGSITSGYPVRTQASSSTYQPTSTQNAHSPHASGPRHSYTTQGQGRYYEKQGQSHISYQPRP